jgi:hypothetical protein
MGQLHASPHMREKIYLRDVSGWWDSETICALSDSARHLGHIILTRNRWNAFDATHLDENRAGFRYLGAYWTQAEAKAAVETSATEPKRMSAAAGWGIRRNVNAISG